MLLKLTDEEPLDEHVAVGGDKMTAASRVLVAAEMSRQQAATMKTWTEAGTEMWMGMMFPVTTRAKGRK